MSSRAPRRVFRRWGRHGTARVRQLRRAADYEVLERNGVSVKGAIAIARYGGSWRGIKPKVDYEHGAVGALIYSEPRSSKRTARQRQDVPHLLSGDHVASPRDGKKAR